MSSSIRTFLLLNLLLSITLITSLAVIGNLYLGHNDLQKHLNAQLAASALIISAFVSDDISRQDLKVIREEIKRKKILDHHQELVPFQIWTKEHVLLLRSSTAPQQPLSKGKPGFSTKWINGQLWHVFTAINANTKMQVDVAERSEFREELDSRMTINSILIMLVTYPILGLLIWVIVGRGLDSIKQVTNEIRQRVPTYLEAVDLEAVPLEIKPLVDELNKLLKRLCAAFKREKRFAADAAHELRTPLAALKVQAQVALQATNEHDIRAALNKVLMGVDRSSHVVQQLLTLSQMASGTIRQEFERVDIAYQAQEVIADLAPTALEKHTEIELTTPAMPVYIMGYPIAISILIRNLVDNAIRYTPANSLINVAIYTKENALCLQVVDNGPGIPEQLHERVFEPFFRILGSKAAGSGLGLGIVQQIVETHGGEIQLGTPKQGYGLEITVVFSKYLKK